MTTHPVSPGWSAAAQSICTNDIIAERYRQLRKWGPQSHLDGTNWASDTAHANAAREECDRAAREGRLTWRHIAMEEFAEALAEAGGEALRTELVQTAAVLVAWIEDLDRRQFARVTEALPIFTDLMEAQPA